jgi:ribosome biogenesis GTPase A
MAAETIVDAHSYSESRMRSGSDPLSRAIRPPENETLQERELRMKAEAKAKKVSDDIDEQIKQERNALKKRKQVNVLLLGQSESGKSTTLKRTLFSPF